MFWLWIVLGVAAIIFGLSYWQEKKTEGIDKFEAVVPNSVYRGSQPDMADYQKMKDLGIKTIINLREEVYANQERPIAESFGFKFLNFPMSGELYPMHHQIEDALQAILEIENDPVFMHCTFGKDRTGTVIGMFRRRVQGWSKWRAFKEMWAHGFNPINVGVFAYYLTH